MRASRKRDAPLERHRALVGDRLERLERGARTLLVLFALVELLDDDLVARLVRRLERLLEAAEAGFVEAEGVGHLVELVVARPA